MNIINQVVAKRQSKKAALTDTAQGAGSGHVVATLYRCPASRVWWGSSSNTTTDDEYLIFRLAEAYPGQFPWDEYRGWQVREAGVEPTCPACNQETAIPVFTLYAHAAVGKPAEVVS